MRAASFLAAVHQEWQRAETIYAPLHSAHEAYAVILEELEEFWEQVRLKDTLREPVLMYEELVQVAAMCLRTVLNLGLDEKEGD